MGNDNHIGQQHEEGVSRRRGYTRNLAENLEGGGLDPTWRWVLLAIAPIFKSDMDFWLDLTCESRLWCPHSSNHLANQPYGVLNRVKSYLTPSRGEGSCLVLP